MFLNTNHHLRSTKNFEIYIHAIFISYQTKTFVDDSNRVKTLSLFLYFLARMIEKKVHRKCNKGGGYH